MAYICTRGVPLLVAATLPSAGRREARRWLGLLVLSVLLHGPLLYLAASWDIRPMSRLPRPSLQVVLLPTSSIPTVNADVAGGQTQDTDRRVERGSVAAIGHERGIPASTSPTIAETSTTAVEDRLRTQALEIARAVGRGPARREEGIPGINLRAPDAGGGEPGVREMRYADGRIKVVDAAGRAYCIKEPPDFVYAVGGVLPRMGIPTTCP